MELLYAKTYKEYKAELDGEFRQAAESFVKIGYLLKVARDTDILADSGYKTVAEFAEAEYSLDKTQVSRFISINDRFSEGGYSDHLLPEYQGFGSSKLALMLQLPDTINEELTPAYSKSDIQAIKDEIDEEKKVSDIEVYLEDKPKMPETGEMPERIELLYQALYDIFKAEPELYVEICNVGDAYKWLKSEAGGISGIHAKIRSIIAPSGEKMYSTRIPGRGRAMLMINEKSYKITLLRTSEKLEYSDKEMEDGFTYCGMWGDGSPEERWGSLYGEKFPVAPEQPDKPEWGKSAKNVENTKSGKDKRVVKVEQSIRKLEDSNSKLEREEEKVEENKGLDATPSAEERADKGGEEDKEACSEAGESASEGDASEIHEDSGQDVETGEAEAGGDAGAVEREPGGCAPDDEVAGEGLVQGGLERYDPYKAAVGQCLKELQDMLEENNGLKYKNMLVIAKDLVWRLEQATKGV
jgi:hypothetical protein